MRYSLRLDEDVWQSFAFNGPQEQHYELFHSSAVVVWRCHANVFVKSWLYDAHFTHENAWDHMQMHMNKYGQIDKV